METPVLFLIFNRPDTTKRVFDAIRKVQPKTLYVAADGPRSDRVEEQTKCAEARGVIDQIDWQCDVKTLYRNENLGCRMAVSSAITWFFSQEEEGIILEDDCLPHPDFFIFCEVMLATYRDEQKVMHITGGNFQFGRKRGEASYYFSSIPHIWGWASWRRAWKQYDVDMKDYPQFLKNPERSKFFLSAEFEKYWLFYFNRVYRKAGTWDFQWTYAITKSGGYCIIPNHNLVSNIGFGNNATHAQNENNPVANMPVHPLGLLSHPSEIQVNEEADLFTIRHAFPTPGLHVRILNKVKAILKKYT